MVTAECVAKYILSKSSLDEGDLVSHLKIQKLLYYCQGFHLAISDSPLFNESIQHWDHGPVVPEVYQAYKSYGKGPLPVPENFDQNLISAESMSIIDEVLSVYDRFSASQLRNMTHNEPPWADTNDCEEITHEKLRSYFKTQLKDS